MAKVAVKKKKKITVFDVVNTIVFILISLLILVPIWKVLVDSLDLRTSYGMSLWPKEFGFDGYITVFSNPTLYKPFLISVVTYSMRYRSWSAAVYTGRLCSDSVEDVGKKYPGGPAALHNDF